jgi:hypothetical protein
MRLHVDPSFATLLGDGPMTSGLAPGRCAPLRRSRQRHVIRARSCQKAAGGWRSSPREGAGGRVRVHRWDLHVIVRGDTLSSWTGLLRNRTRVSHNPPDNSRQGGRHSGPARDLAVLRAAVQPGARRDPAGFPAGQVLYGGHRSPRNRLGRKHLSRLACPPYRAHRGLSAS